MTHLTATLPTSWDDVPLLPFCRLLAAKTLADQVTATAELVGVEPELLLADFKAYAAIKADLGFMSELPPAQDAMPELLHAGVLYHHVGNLQTISVGQMEALVEFLHEHEAAPLLAAPHLLAVLYKPAGLSLSKWDANAITNTATAFEALPVSLAWPALTNFLVATGPLALTFRQYSAARDATTNLLTTIEGALPPLGGIVRRISLT
jgi:hypothetical protein